MTSPLRALAERLSRGVVLRRRLPERHGGHLIFVSPDASLRFWKRRLESTDPLLLDLCAELVAPGASVWDLGANVGLFTLASAHHSGASGAVLSVEADPFLAGLVQRSAQALPATCAPIVVVQAAVADHTGVAWFTVAGRSRAASHLHDVAGSSQSGGARSTIEVPVTQVDDLLLRHRAPDVVKIDVEGAELLCLHGAHQLLSQVRPTLLCEVSAGNSATVGALLRGYEYTLVDGALPRTERRPLTGDATWNTIAIPSLGLQSAR